MKCNNLRHLAQTTTMLAGMALVVACQNNTSRFADSSQGTLVADTKPGASGETGLAREGGGMPEGLGRSGGYYYYIHNGAAVRLTQHQRFVEGLSYEGRGRIVSSSGSIVRLNNGEMVTFAGDRLPFPPGISIP